MSTKYYILVEDNDGFDSFIEDAAFVRAHGTPVVRTISLNTEDPKFFSSRATAEKVLRKIQRIAPGLEAVIIQERTR